MSKNYVEKLEWMMTSIIIFLLFEELCCNVDIVDLVVIEKRMQTFNPFLKKSTNK